jgi:hypothetical protein
MSMVILVFHADTDDQIDFKAGGTDVMVFTAANTKFNVGFL